MLANNVPAPPAAMTVTKTRKEVKQFRKYSN